MSLPALVVSLALAVPPCAPARLVIAPAGRVDLGELGPLEARTREYTFTNASPAPIRLRVLDLAPGVSVAGPALLGPIPARGSALLRLRVDPAGWVGPQARNVRLGTDDPAQGTYYLPIRMTVRPDLTVDGVRRDFGDVAAFESPAAQFRFNRETGKPLALRVVSGLPPYLEAEVRADGPRARLAFTLRADRVPAGMRLGLDVVRVETNAPLQPGFDLYLEWRLHHPIEAQPARLVFAEAPDTLELRLRTRDGRPFRILEAELEGRGFCAGPPSGTPAPEQAHVLRRTATAPARATLVLRCSGTDEPVRVPLAYLPGGEDESAMVVNDMNG